MVSIEGKKIRFDKAVLLAPMAGVTDYAFRRLCLEQGAEFVVSEMISAKAMHFKDSKTAQLARLRSHEAPCAVQIFGHEPDIMAEAAASLSDGSYKGCISEIPPSAIDINMGCPVKKIVTNGEGSALMKKPELAYEVISAVVSSTPLPVTVKIRAGWDEDNINAVQIAGLAEKAGAAAICVHGRTRDQLYRPPVNLDIIRDVKRSVSIPVIGNGGINCEDDALRMFEYTGCDAVMVARGALGNPWIFARIKNRALGREWLPLSDKEIIDCAVRHLELICEDKGEVTGVPEARKHIAWYVRGMKGAAALRCEVMRIDSLDEIRNRLRSFI